MAESTYFKSQCLIFSVFLISSEMLSLFYFILQISNVLSPADLSFWFRLKFESRKTFNIIAFTKTYIFFKFQFVGEGEGRAGLQPRLECTSV